jgi:pteridine reductase
MSKPFSARPVALVTGGASFIGKAISLKLAEEGFDLTLHYQNSGGKAKELAEKTKELGARTLLVQGDLRWAGVSSVLVQRTTKAFKRLDLLVNNASLFYPTPIEKAKPQQWSELFQVNSFAPYFLSRAAAPWLKKVKGSIVNLTDIYGENPILKGYDAYCASKSALITLTKILARELGPVVRVNGVSPGAIFIPKNYSSQQKKALLDRSALKRQGSPDDIAEAVFFLAHQNFITGQVLKVDGGRFL